MTPGPQNQFPSLIVFPAEVQMHAELFERMPLTIIQIFLECFNDQGDQGFAVPQHVLEALAKRFLRLTKGHLNSLDAAFGGRVAHQRNRLRTQDLDFSVAWAIGREIEMVKAQSVEERGAGTPFEIAVERVAQEFSMSGENVRRIYKRSGSRSAISKSRTLPNER